MMRLLISILLSLCFLLPKGSIRLPDLTNQHRIGYLPRKFPPGSAQAGFSAIVHNKAVISKANLPGTKEASDPINAVEIEEDDDKLPSSRKHADHCTSFYAQCPGYCCSLLTNRLPSCNHFSYCSAYKFIIHRVIRI